MNAILLMMLVSLGFPRPPAIVPPYPYDSNMVNSEILKWIEVAPDNRRILLSMKAFEPDGDDVILTCSNSSVWIPPKTDNDPNTGGGVYYQVTNTPELGDPNAVTHLWVCDIRIGFVEEVKYFNFNIADVPRNPNDPVMYDDRCVLVFVRTPPPPPTNRAPILDIGTIEHILN